MEKKDNLGELDRQIEQVKRENNEMQKKIQKYEQSIPQPHDIIFSMAPYDYI